MNSQQENLNLNLLEKQASEVGLILRIKETRPINLWAIRVVVAKQVDSEIIKIFGELKAWAYPRKAGLQLDTMKVINNAESGIGDLIWAATMAWAIERTPCETARLLAINDNDNYHQKLVRYFQRKGFEKIKIIESSPKDLPLRTIWGGSGTLMRGDCKDVFERSYKRWLIFSERAKDY